MTRQVSKPDKKQKHWVRRLLLTVVFFALVISGFQYYQTGRLNWYQTPFIAAKDFFEDYTSEAPVITPETVEGLELVGLVSSITDGDTLILRSPVWQSHTIRLYGIDTPEWNQPHGDAASRALNEKVSFKTVTVKLEDIDTYGRYVGTVFLDDRNINLEMVAEGHAWWYEFFAEDSRELEIAQETARNNKSGLWANPDPIAPWDWRRTN